MGALPGGGRGRGQRETDRRKGSPVCLGLSHPEKGRMGPEGNGGAPARPGYWRWVGSRFASIQRGLRHRGNPPPTEGRPPSPVAGVTFVSSDVPTQPLTLRPNDRGRLRAPPGLGCHLRKMGSLPPRCAAPRSRGDGGRGGGAEGVNVPGPPPTLRAPPPAAGKRRASAGARLDLRPCPPPPAPVRPRPPLSAPVPVPFLVPARPPAVPEPAAPRAAIRAPRSAAAVARAAMSLW